MQLTSGRPGSSQGPALSWESELQSVERSERKPVDKEGGEQDKDKLLKMEHKVATKPPQIITKIVNTY